MWVYKTDCPRMRTLVGQATGIHTLSPVIVLEEKISVLSACPFSSPPKFTQSKQIPHVLKSKLWLQLKNGSRGRRGDQKQSRATGPQAAQPLDSALPVVSRKSQETVLLWNRPQHCECLAFMGLTMEEDPILNTFSLLFKVRKNPNQKTQTKSTNQPIKPPTPKQNKYKKTGF